MARNISTIFKKIIADKQRKEKKLKQALGDDVGCYVLIYCSKPDEKGNIEVELVYEGERHVAAYLIDSAQGVLD